MEIAYDLIKKINTDRGIVCKSFKDEYSITNIGIVDTFINRFGT